MTTCVLHDFKPILQWFSCSNNRFYATITKLKKKSKTEIKDEKAINENNSEEQEKNALLDKKISNITKESHALKINNYFNIHPHLKDIKNTVPEKYLQLKRMTPPENVYLIDRKAAELAVSHILPAIANTDQIISETNAGLGFISEELLKNNIKLIRIYESCPDFKLILKERLNQYQGQFELFTKDIFLIHRYDYLDKQDHGNRVEQLWKGVPKKDWGDDPSLTIIGAMFNLNFIRFLVKSLVLQSFIMHFGRVQLFTFIRPKDYVVLTAGPHLNLHTYQNISVFFNLFFDIELLEKFPRQIFLPWESKKTSNRYAAQVDPDMVYFVKINLKKKLPISIEYLLPFHAFVKQFFSKGTTRIIPVLEKWVPGVGLEVLFPKFSHNTYFDKMDIYTKFGELTPEQILYVFEEMISHPGYSTSPFIAMVENQFMKSETIETSLDEQLEKHIVNDINIKINN